MTTEHNRRSSDLMAMEITQLKFENERLKAELGLIKHGLTDKEVEFVIDVIRNPGCKLNNGSASYYDTDDNYIINWKNPENLGLIKCVGSYKWLPTDRVKLGLIITTPQEG